MYIIGAMPELLKIAPESLCWNLSDEAKQIPIYDLASLPKLATTTKARFKYADEGHYGFVFRWKPINQDPITVKVLKMRHREYQASTKKLFKKSPYKIDGELRLPHYSFDPSSIEKYHNLMLRQVEGHLQGNQKEPELIDPPKIIWATNIEGNYHAFGYSIPFIEGTPIRIIEDHELYEKYRSLLESKIYVGNVGAFTNSTNAIITKKGIKKFIDVRTLLPGEYVSL